MYSIGPIRVDFEKVDNCKYQLYLLYGGNSMVIHLSENFNSDIKCIASETIGSEHYLWEESDYFRFDYNGSLHSIILRIPNSVKTISSGKMNDSILKSLKLLENPIPCVVKQTKIRYFDLMAKRLVCTNGIENITQSEIKLLNKDFGLIFNKREYVGYIINDPLQYLTDSFGKIDVSKPTDVEYRIFDKCMRIVSDNNLEQHNGSMEEIAKQLSNEIVPELDNQKSKRVSIMKKEIGDLIDFWL